MKFSWPFAIALVFTTAVGVKADFIPWSYNWSQSMGAGAATLDPTSHIAYIDMFEYSITHNVVGSQPNISAIKFVASGSSTANFTNIPFTVSINLEDGLSGKWGVLNFSSVFTGTTYNLGIKFANPSQMIYLGDHSYTVTLNSFVSPTVTQPRTILTANVAVSNAPEPGTLLLSGLGMAILGIGYWWRRLRTAQMIAISG